MAIEKVKLEDFLRKVSDGDDSKLNGVILFIHPSTEVLIEGVQALTTPREVLITYRHKSTASGDWDPYQSMWTVKPEYTVTGVSSSRMARAVSGVRSHLRIECATS